jgi:hypothetical protein
VQLKPDDTHAWYSLGLACHGLGQQSQVVKIYKKLKTFDPKLADKLSKLAAPP